MALLKRIKQTVKKPLQDMIKSRVNKELERLVPSLVDFYNSPPENKQSYYDHTKTPLESYQYYCNLKNGLIENGIPVEDINVSIDDFQAWLKKFPVIYDSYKSSGDTWIEKCLEHYLSYHFLKLTGKDVFIDIAAYSSPYARMLIKQNIESYRLDMSYPAGIKGINIGADASDTKLPDNFASALALHCAYECFMGDADKGFIKEASRILNVNGRYIILPLYIDQEYFISTSPFCDQGKVKIDPGARKVWRDDAFKMPFSRHYSPKVFADRIFSKIPGDMQGKIMFIKNLPDLMSEYPDQLIYCYFIFYCCKK